MTRQEWKPLADGKYQMPGFLPGYTYTLNVTGDGADLEAWSNDPANKLNDGSPLRVEEIGIGDYRLCQLVEVPEPTSVPNQLLEAMAMTEELLRLTYIPDHNWGDEEYQLRDRIIQRHAAIVAWLDQQGATDANT